MAVDSNLIGWCNENKARFTAEIHEYGQAAGSNIPNLLAKMDELSSVSPNIAETMRGSNFWDCWTHNRKVMKTKDSTLASGDNETEKNTSFDSDKIQWGYLANENTGEAKLFNIVYCLIAVDLPAFCGPDSGKNTVNFVFNQWKQYGAKFANEIEKQAKVFFGFAAPKDSEKQKEDGELNQDAEQQEGPAVVQESVDASKVEKVGDADYEAEGIEKPAPETSTPPPAQPASPETPDLDDNRKNIDVEMGEE